MADTRRELAALQTLLGDNTSGDISAQDARDVLVSAAPVNVHPSSAYASPPSAPVTGDLWLPSDGVALLRYSGSAWVPWGPAFPLANPAAQTWTWTNQGSATETDVGGGLCLVAPSTGGSYSIPVRRKSAPSTPYLIDTMLSVQNSQGAGGDGQAIGGVGWRESSSGKLILVGISCFQRTSGSSERYFWIAKFTNPTTYSAHYLNTTHSGIMPTFIRISDDGTNRKVAVSTNGQVWYVVHTIGRTDFLTADQVGFMLATPSSDGQMTLFHWREY